MSNSDFRLYLTAELESRNWTILYRSLRGRCRFRYRGGGSGNETLRSKYGVNCPGREAPLCSLYGPERPPLICSWDGEDGYQELVEG